MTDNYTVKYTVKHCDPMTPSLYGLLIDRKARFDTLRDAVKFAREIRGVTKNGVVVVGNPEINWKAA